MHYRHPVLRQSYIEKIVSDMQTHINSTAAFAYWLFEANVHCNHSFQYFSLQTFMYFYIIIKHKTILRHRDTSI